MNSQQAAVVVDRSHSRASRDEQFESGYAEGVLNVDGHEADAQPIVRRPLQLVLARPGLRPSPPAPRTGQRQTRSMLSGSKWGGIGSTRPSLEAWIRPPCSRLPPVVARALRARARAWASGARRSPSGAGCCMCSPASAGARAWARSEPAPASGQPGSSPRSSPEVPFVTVELDADLATAAAGLVRGGRERDRARAAIGTSCCHRRRRSTCSSTTAAEAASDLDGERVVGLLAPGGTVVLDDLTPGRSGPDPVRDFWLEHPRLAAIELLTTPETAVILAVHV